ncbi:MAG: hypothetical protein ACRC6J_04055 [Cetobacterium sp.]
MDINDLKINDIYTSDEIVETFKVNKQGSMRMSLTNNCLVLTCNHIEKIYNDRWEGNTLYYTGMGLKENSQIFEKANKKLKDSNELGIDIYLFEVFIAGKYIFSGKVFLSDTPTIEKQYNELEKCDRDVAIFPLKKYDINSNEYDNIRNKIVAKKSLEELNELYAQENKKLEQKVGTINSYNRSLLVKQIALKKAEGICQLCNESDIQKINKFL